MYLKHAAFNHESKNWIESINLTKEIVDICHERILFSVFSNALNIYLNYDNPVDAPAVIRSRSGDLKLTLSTITDEREYDFTLLIFVSIHQYAVDCFNRYTLMNNMKLSPEKKQELKVVQDIEELEAQRENRAGTYQSASEAIKRIELVKQSLYDFDKYMLLVETMAENQEVDNLINRAISKY